MQKISDEFVIAVGLLLVSFFIFQTAIFPTLNKGNLEATVSNSLQDSYNIDFSKTAPGTFTFDYKFVSVSPPRASKNFDASIMPFNETKAREDLATPFADFGGIRDAWGYPVRKNFYHTASSGALAKKEEFVKRTVPATTVKSDNDPNNPGIVNCRINTNITGYFRAYFEDVALDTNAGYDDSVYGLGRREEVCIVLQDIATLIKLDQTTVTPDIIFSADQNIPPNALAAATAYFGYYSIGEDNGSLHKHIISRDDPTPGQGNFDAMILTNFNGISWDVDSTLNPGTYDFYTVIYHEVMHALGFRGLLPAVIGSIGNIQTHGTFDFFSYKNDTLADRFFDGITRFLNVPIGAPAPWFITNQVVYRGIKNIVGAIPDAIRPVFSPLSWQQGSSLSHFDMSRAIGETYVMHPSIGTNTVRPINNHEKEVLCHEGYEVLGMTGCENPTPFAEDDSFLLQPVVCVPLLQNDESFSGGLLSINSLTLTNIQPGDSLTYYLNNTCNGATTPNPLGAKSFIFSPTTDPSPRSMTYSNKDSVSNRISNIAQISFVGCNSDPEEYVCNGDFEMTPLIPLNNYTNSLYCGTSYDVAFRIPFWCGELSPDLANYNSTPGGFWYSLPFECTYYTNCEVNTLSGDGAAGVMIHNPGWWRESIASKLKQPILAGESYRLSFDVFVLKTPAPSQTWITAKIDSGIDNMTFSATNNTLNFNQQILNQSVDSNTNQWDHVSIDFVPNADSDSLFFIPNIVGAASGIYYIDNISIREVPAGDNGIEGIVYVDQDSDGGMDSGESGLSGVQIGLFQNGNPNPLQTVTSENIPNLGRYEFTGVPDGINHVALLNENIFTSISEPILNTGVVPGYNRVRSVSVSGGQIDDENNFGVGLEEGVVEPVPVDISLKKELIDATLSLFDRNITWRVKVSNLGPNNATNINVSDTIPPGLLYISHTTQNMQENYNPITGVYNIPSLAAGSQTQIEIVMKVPNTGSVCGVKTNTASLVSLGQIDTNPANNSMGVGIKLKPCNIQMVK